MVSMFRSTAFNQPIGDWDVSSVAAMKSMFQSTAFNHPIGGWDVSRVTVKQYLFRLHTTLSQLT